MKIVQSRYQNIFSRFYVMSVNIFWYLVFAIPATLFFSVDMDIIFFVKLSIVFTTLFILYLWLIKSGPSKTIVIKENGFEYFDYEMKKQVQWDDFKGYKITKSMPYQIIIEIDKQQNIEFGYYVFSSKQRKALFSVFDEKQS